MGTVHPWSHSRKATILATVREVPRRWGEDAAIAMTNDTPAAGPAAVRRSGRRAAFRVALFSALAAAVVILVRNVEVRLHAAVVGERPTAAGTTPAAPAASETASYLDGTIEVAITRFPTFAAYAVHEGFTGRPAQVDLKSDPDAPRFRTRLREGAATGPNFAGHFTIVTWGCGTDCQVTAVVDALSG